MIELYCDNKELLQELNDKEEVFRKIEERILRCPHCGQKGHFYLDDYDQNDLTYDYWVCGECDKVPSSERQNLLDNIVLFGKNEYWNYGIFELVNTFEYGECHEYGSPKIRNFDPKAWNAEKHTDYCDAISGGLTWEDYVERTIKDHIKVLDEAIERAKKVPMLKSIFKEVNK